MAACKAKGIAVMLDIVGNHMGPPSAGSGFREFTPFNKTEHYHGTLSAHCSDINTNQHTREVCWYGLPSAVCSSSSRITTLDFGIVAGGLVWLMRGLRSAGWPISETSSRRIRG
jgi:hypothetical protein